MTPLEAWQARVRAAVERFEERQEKALVPRRTRDDEARGPGAATRANERTSIRWEDYTPPKQ